MDIKKQLEGKLIEIYKKGYGVGYFESLDLIDTLFMQLDSEHKLNSKEDFKDLMDNVLAILNRKDLSRIYFPKAPENSSQNLEDAVKMCKQKMNRSFAFGYQDGKDVLSRLYRAVYQRFYFSKTAWKRVFKNQIKKLAKNYNEIQI